jgi:lysine biosynthesis protein LysW
MVTHDQKGGIAMPSAYCPDCDEKIVLNNPRVGQKLLCPHCDTEVEVIGTDPLDLDWAYDMSYDEDWADEDEDD